MLSLRIVSAGAIATLIVAATVSGAAAQSGSPAPGRPLSLLAGLLPPHETKTAVHPKTSHRIAKKAVTKRRVARTKLASRKHHEVAAAEAAKPPVQATPGALPENAWPVVAPDTALPPADVAAAAAPAPETAPAANADMQPSKVVVDGQTVQIASPDEVNAIDLAADNHADTPAAMPADQADATAPTQTVLAPPARLPGS